ncbi:dipeptidase [Thermoactinomyces mirandus]|uniref:Membrane dipeptidase n=1 Tax=Thermoactinomyces mirandus TaxID=2756294 RepID=A0A7W1XV24_9BACL|nr:dipeptidase [Thermoactinomyces mirandus]MBA4603721.1 membrane dipeptidase [Thermoactinomyces mirandus]
MQWLDEHCDVLSKMWENLSEHLFYDANSKLDSSYHKLREAAVALQVFAIWVPESVPRAERLSVALKQADLFYEQIIQQRKQVHLVDTKSQLKKCSQNRMGAILTMEGADALQGELENLRLFFRLGVRQLGLTWNYANEAADGIEEDRNGGLTLFGKKLIAEMERLGIILDVSHLSVRGFWEVIGTNLPILASHSNCLSITPHKRNLDDEQIRAIINKQGLIGITFVPSFVCQPSHKATVDHILRHIEHVCSLGGENHLCFGSDFDGIENKIKNLRNYKEIYHLKNALLQHYPESMVKKWAWDNGFEFYLKHLPS